MIDNDEEDPKEARENMEEEGQEDALQEESLHDKEV